MSENIAGWIVVILFWAVVICAYFKGYNDGKSGK
jgi:hypothetical protein